MTTTKPGSQQDHDRVPSGRSGPGLGPRDVHGGSRMEIIKGLRWPLIVVLAVVALARPIMSITGLTDDLGRPLTPLVVTAAVSVIWIASVVLARVNRPVLTLIFAGLGYGVFSIILSGILSPILNGQLEGPLATPVAIIPVLIVNGLWGAVAGLIAKAVQGARPGRSRHS